MLVWFKAVLARALPPRVLDSDVGARARVLNREEMRIRYKDV